MTDPDPKLRRKRAQSDRVRDGFSQVRIPERLYHRLLDASVRSGRSISEEINLRVTQSFQDEDRRRRPSDARFPEFVSWVIEVLDAPLERNHLSRLCLEAAIASALDHLAPVPPLPSGAQEASDEAAVRSAYSEAGRELGQKLRIEDEADATLAAARRRLQRADVMSGDRAAMIAKMQQLHRAARTLASAGDQSAADSTTDEAPKDGD